MENSVTHTAAFAMIGARGRALTVTANKIHQRTHGRFLLDGWTANHSSSTTEALLLASTTSPRKCASAGSRAVPSGLGERDCTADSPSAQIDGYHYRLLARVTNSK